MFFKLIHVCMMDHDEGCMHGVIQYLPQSKMINVEILISDPAVLLHTPMTPMMRTSYFARNNLHRTILAQNSDSPTFSNSVLR